VFDDGGVHDARLLDQRPPDARRVEARHPWVWIRRDGEWRKGAIHCWYVRDGTWLAWMQHDKAEPDHPQADWGAVRVRPGGDQETPLPGSERER
jgi:hypothetical protein